MSTGKYFQYFQLHVTKVIFSFSIKYILYLRIFILFYFILIDIRTSLLYTVNVGLISVPVNSRSTWTQQSQLGVDEMRMSVAELCRKQSRVYPGVYIKKANKRVRNWRKMTLTRNNTTQSSI